MFCVSRFENLLGKGERFKKRVEKYHDFLLFGINFSTGNERVDFKLALDSVVGMLKFTDSALIKVKEMSADAGEGKLLRIFVEAGGCSGFEYGMSLDNPKPSDQQGEFSGVRYAVDGDSLDYLKGSEIHFDDGLSGKGFEIRNPNAESTCGCGKSFS